MFQALTATLMHNLDPDLMGRYGTLRYLQSAPWQMGTPMRRCRPMKPKNRAYKRAKTKAQRVARRNNRR